jgi:hypothetical protein
MRSDRPAPLYDVQALRALAASDHGDHHICQRVGWIVVCTSPLVPKITTFERTLLDVNVKRP